MEKIYVGPAGSGKTTKLKQHYHQLVTNNQTDICLVLTVNAPHVLKWKREVELDAVGSLEVYAYFSFVQKELRQYWPFIEEKITVGEDKLSPTFMTVETAHYIMGKLVEKYRAKDYFLEVNATAQQIAVQLIDNLNYAAMNGLDFSDVKERLKAWAAEDEEKKVVYNSGFEVMKNFAELSWENRCFDYSQAIEIYNRYLLAEEKYLQELFSRYEYLFVDNLEKMVPTAQDLILNLIPKMLDSYLSYNPEGQFARFFGAAPELVEENFLSSFKIEKLEESYTSSPLARELADSLARKVTTGDKLTAKDLIKERIHCELRSEMTEAVAEKIADLVNGGVKPEEIAVVAPYVDKVLNFTLKKKAEEKAYNFMNLTQDRLLMENPFAQALIVLTVLAKPSWDINISFSALVKTFSLILEFDPVRSSLLAERVLDNELNLPPMEELKLRSRVGFRKAEKYDAFRDWLLDWRKTDFKLEYFFRSAFANFLSTLETDKEDILACRKLIKSIVKFREVVGEFKEFSEAGLSEKFVEMVNKGTLAAEVLLKPEDVEDRVVLATPYSFLSFPDLEQVKYLFLLDLSSEFWFLGGGKELSNPFVLSRSQSQVEWSDAKDQSLQREQLASYLQNLLTKVTKGVYLADSTLNSRGWEQEGRLADWMEI